MSVVVVATIIPKPDHVDAVREAILTAVPKVHEGSRVLTFGYDGGEGYLPAEVLA